MLNLKYLRHQIDNFFIRFGFGMKAKLISLFVVIKVVPLVLLAFLAWQYSASLGDSLGKQTDAISSLALNSLTETGRVAVHDAVNALDERARENLERMTTDTAHAVAMFLYARDSDILLASTLEPSQTHYENFLKNRFAHVVQEGEWELSEDGTTWQRATPKAEQKNYTSSNSENNLDFHYRAPDGLLYNPLPLYREITFVDTSGQEVYRVVTRPEEQVTLRNVSDKKNTFLKAEDYFAALQKLQPGEIYVSEVIGAYTPSKVIGIYNKANAAKVGEEFDPLNSAYAGMENPVGKRFDGIIRWATPVEEDGEIIGYVTLALDHRHLMEFTSHIMPTDERYTELPDASEGNYAFIWDYKGRSIVHPRHFSITGYNPETGEPEIPWLEDRIYDEWQASGKKYVDFIEGVPTFVEQSTSKKPAPALTKAGKVGLDCRYLNFAPQCTGWFDLTQDGGSGSFGILWSGLNKLTTAAAIPYYTGSYGASKRGFGFVTIGSGLDYFHEPAIKTEAALNTLIESSDKSISLLKQEAHKSIAENLLRTASSLTISTVIMVVLVIVIAIYLASTFTKSITKLIDGISRFHKGERHFRFKAPIKDELGTLADSFDTMADSLVNSVNWPLLITSMDKSVIYANSSWLELCGVELEDIVGKSYTEYTIFPLGSAYCPIAALEEGRQADIIYFEKTGRYYRAQAMHFYGQSTEGAGYLIQASDVTEIATEQKKIEEQRALLDTIFTSSPDIIWYKERSGRYLAVNPRFAQLLGIPISDIIGKTFIQLFSKQDVAVFLKNEQQVYATGKSVYAEETLTFADGHVETVDSVRTPIFNFSKEVIGILGVSRNVSERVAAESALKAAQTELEITAQEARKASEAKSEFLARMSHEIRTPMNAIIGMSQISLRKLMEAVPDIAEITAHVQQISVSSQHLLGLLNDILDISKIEAGKIELVEEIFELPKLLNNVASIIKPRCQEKHITFEINISDTEPSVFISDALRIRQVLINLLGNAVKFTPDGGSVCLLVEYLDIESDKAQLKFTVRDSGIGMPESVLAGLFTPFEQGNSQITRKYGGTGLGLSISRSIVRLLGGDIIVKSEVGSGSEFSFTLWLPHTVQQNIMLEGKAVAETIKGKRMLLVDDIDINRLIVQEQLAETGLLIEEAEDGAKAVEKFTESPDGYFDIIFMDIQMPVLNGYEAAKTIRQLDRHDAITIPIVAMTANAFTDDIERAMQAGMTAHLAKPLELDKMFEVLHSVIHRNKTYKNTN